MAPLDVEGAQAMRGTNAPSAVDPVRRRCVGAAATLGVVAFAQPRRSTAAAPAMTELNVTTSDGVRLHAVSAGPAPVPGGRPPIVLLPGWSMPATIFRPQIEGLSDRHPLLAFDPRGQGESEVPKTGYTADRRADDLADVLATLPPAVVVGWSLGVIEALQYVHRHGESRLRGLVLVDNSVGEPPPPKGSDFLRRLRADRRAALERFVRAMFATPRPEEEYSAILRSALRMPLEASIALLSYPQPREHWRGIVRGFRQPLAYWVTPPWQEQAASLQANRPGTQVEVFADAGHALFVDQPTRFNALLDGFVAGVP